MSMSEPFEPELDGAPQTSVADTEGEDEPDVFLPQPSGDQGGPDDAEGRVHLPDKTPFRHPDPDDLQR